MSLTKRKILELMFSVPETDSINFVANHILALLDLQIDDIDASKLKRLKDALCTLRCKRTAKWQAANRSRDRFESKNKDWLDSEFCFSYIFNEIRSQTVQRQGRPQLDFDEKSDRSKRREAARISNESQNNPAKLLMACQHAARNAGDRDLYAVLKELSNDSDKPTKVRKVMQQPRTSIVKMQPEEALAYLLERNMSKSDYQSIRSLVKSKGANIFPSYNDILAVKPKCRPDPEYITITEVSAEVSLQGLLNHTSKRLLQLQEGPICQLIEKSNTKEIEVSLICSWGFDGSSGHSAYKQSFTNKDLVDIEENIFATSLIPLRLVTSDNIIFWSNRASQSPKFCRPIKLEFEKESIDVIKAQKHSMQEQINSLEYFQTVLNECTVRVHFSLLLTLIDGKVLNAITGNRSTQSCPVCKAKPLEFNNLSNPFIPDPNALQYGLSPLHTWIRFLECCLHLSYKLNIKVWQLRRPEHKIAFAERKKEIQNILWEKLALRVDKPKVGGSGNTNDGNTARRAFTNPKKFAEYLGIEPQLITNFQTILIALSSHLPIDPSRFDALCKSTARIFVETYPWFIMPASVHKILMHGADIIKNSILPIEMLGEEASEARNKDYRNFRREHSRKNSRIANIQDTFYRLMDTSDPIISSINLDSRIRNAGKSKKIFFSEEVRNLFAIPIIETDIAELDSDDDDNTGLAQSEALLLDIELSDEEIEEQ